MNCCYTKWDWTPARYAAFERLKAAFLSRPVLLIPDYLKPFIIEADASLLFATGAVLLQEDSNGDGHPTGYLSHSLNPAE